MRYIVHPASCPAIDIMHDRIASAIYDMASCRIYRIAVVLAATSVAQPQLHGTPACDKRTQILLVNVNRIPILRPLKPGPWLQRVG